MKVRIIALLWCITLSASNLCAAPFLEGNVKDEQGRPIKGVSVKIWDCVGTCLGGKTVLTDAAGHYVFEQKPFRNFPSLAISMPGRYEVSRQQSGPKLSEPDTKTPRQVNFVLGTPAAASIYLIGEVPEGWTQSLTIRSGRDVKLHRYDFKANHISGWDYWNSESLPRNESLHLVVIREPVLVKSDDPKETRKRQRENRKNRVKIISPALRLIDPQRYEIKAKIVYDDESETSYINLDSIRDALSADRTDELTVYDPKFGPPVDETIQKQALGLLKRVADAAAPWNARPSKKIDSYEYDIIDAKTNTTHIKIDQNSPSGPSWNDISRLRGFAYMPPLRWLFSQPENIVIHGFESKADQAVLDYRLKSQRGFGAGLGVGPSWNGFFTTQFSSGTIVIDTKNGTVLEHRLSRGLLGQESIETFRDYVAVNQGYAPRSLRIQSGSQDFQLSFRIHKETLWLLDEASHKNQSEPAFKVTNVIANITE